MDEMMKKSLYLLMAFAVMTAACSKKEAPAEPTITEPETVPMSAEPADPNTAINDAATTQDPVVLEPIEGESAPADAEQTGGEIIEEEIIESVDDDGQPNQ